MSAIYDVVVAGGGHNGLTVAAYLAKAGVKVVVVEATDQLGGGATSAALNNPGFIHDHASSAHMWIRPNPLLQRDELELQYKYGLKYLTPKALTALLYPDDRVLQFWQDVDDTCESISQFSQKDAIAYRRFFDWANGSYEMLVTGMFNDPAPFGPMMAMLDSSPEGRELLRALMMSADDMAIEWFESPHLRNAIGRLVSEGMTHPQTKGTGLNALLFAGLTHNFGWGVAEGGAQSLSNALAAAVRDHGGTILTSSPIARFTIDGKVCTGVVLESGEQIKASKAVVSSLNIKQLPGLADPGALPADWVDKIGRVSHSFMAAFRQSLDLN